MNENLKSSLDKLTNELSNLMATEDLWINDLTEAAENLLPALVDALHKAGFGKQSDSDE